MLPKVLNARPTTDRARESLINILMNRVDFETVRVIDLFAGTGMISFEFASQGVQTLWAVENNRIHCESIRQNISLLDIPQLHLLQTDVFRLLRHPPGIFDLVFADPPFYHQKVKELPTLILSSGILAPGGTLIMEHGPRVDFSNFQGFRELRRYGKVHFSFFDN